MSLISAANLTFAYEGSYDNVFENASFQLDTDWKLGFVGRNGRGKTTLLRLLTGDYEYRGSLTASVPFDYFPYPVSDRGRDAAAVAEAVIGEDFARWALVVELSLLEMDEGALSRPFDTLSHGERAKLLLAALFLKPERFLLIDEPTDHLDEKAREVVARYLRAKKGFILVSHDRWLLDNCVDHILSINRGGIAVRRGNFSDWFAERQQRDASELAQNKRLKKEIKRLEVTSREKAAWSDKTEASKIGGHVYDRGYVGHKAAKTMKRAKNIENRIDRERDEKAKLLKNIEKADALTVTPLTHHADWLIELKDVSAAYGGKPVCENVSFTLRRGDRVALKGRNGSGKSSLLALCLGKGEAAGLTYTGELRTASGLVISYVPQDTSYLTGSLTDFAREHGLDDAFFKAILRKLDFGRAQFDKDMRDFSSGQQKKTLLAKSLCERAHVYIWDEPLNFVDVLSRVQIEDLILAGRPTLLFVEHDRAFAEKIATRAVELP